MMPNNTSALSLIPPSHQRSAIAINGDFEILSSPQSGNEFKSLFKSLPAPNFPAHASVLNAPDSSTIVN